MTKHKRQAGDWLDLLVGIRDGTDNDYGADQVCGVLGTFAQDCTCPTKDAIIWACEYCRKYINPCPKGGWYHHGKGHPCHREALVQELHDAYIEMQDMEPGYGLAMGLSWEEYLEDMESPLRDPLWVETGQVSETVEGVV